MKKFLAADDVHVWQCFVADWPDKDRTELLTKLSSAERTRCAAFHFEKDRALFALSHALARAALSLYTEIPPGDLSFELNAYGKPRLTGNDARGIQFNITHCAGYVACAVARDEVGIDAENIERGCDMDVAKHVYVPLELQQLTACSAEHACTRFFELWTLKEAYIKAQGAGMSMDLQSFWFDLSTAPVSISFAPNVSERPRDWEFHSFQPAPQLRMAVACRSAGLGPPSSRKNVEICCGTKLLRNGAIVEAHPSPAA